MIVPLLPVFLVASLNVNESDWKYGPEVIYDAKINGSEIRTVIDEKIDFNITWTYHVTKMKLKCRPKNETTFSCRFHEPKVQNSLDMKNFKYISNFDHPFEFNIDPDRQDDNHVYVASSSITKQQIDIIRAFMDTLNVPIFMKKLRDGDVNIIENSTIGIQCPTNYVTSSIKLKEDSLVTNKTKSYEILLTPGTNIPKGQEKSIIRRRVPKKCYNMIMGYLPNNHTRQIFRMWSNAIMNITKNSFLSEEQATYMFLKFDSNRVRPFGGEKISLILEDIVPASEPIPIIRDPVSFGTAGNQVFHTKSIYEQLWKKNDSKLP